MGADMKKFTTISALLPALALAAGTASAAGPAEWAPPGGDDLRIQSLPATVPAAPPSRHVESKPVSYAWPLTIDRSAPAPSGPAMESREYWVDTTGRGLEQGLKLPLSSAGAIVRVSALHADTGLLLDAERLQVSIDGMQLSQTAGAGGIEVLGGADLQAQGMAVPADTLAFQLPQQGRPDSLRLQMAGLPAGQALVVHVFEPESQWMGRLAANRHNYLAGNDIALDVGLVKGDERFAAESIQAVLVSPDAAHSWPLEVTDDGFGLKGLAPQDLPDAGEGLYEVHAYLQGHQDGTLVRRDLKVAVSIAAPTARLTDRIASNGSAGLAIDLGVEVAAAGRYQVSGQVWGTAADGSLRPLAMAQTAAVLEPGKGELRLDVPAELVLESGLSAPFEVREVQLLDQGRMAVLETRSRGFTVARDAGGPRRPFDTIEQ
ncbi:DUF4785 family protein [Wenzhouxiangella sediminis]|uniref:DUF4785 family protein n=2 Tax=Wenzhouxiangella sediminis TaxID=1792836 RepID=A0A3E1K873_9GAMM|nr:DUF4785 family protein [Wenzhouxiangella sediminis]